MPEQPTSDATPDAPATPDASGMPATPDASATPATPATPGASTVPAAPADPAAPATPGPEAPKAGSKRKKILSAIATVVVVLAVKFGLGYMLADQPVADSLSVGQCVKSGDDDSIAKVDCGDAKAEYKVVFIKKDTVQSLADQTCAPYEATTTTYFEYREGETNGNVICLGAVR
ncbi:LppU/SCO3897 family protein [Intrasporangium flavum]|uniref:LppU/SCO3897 family protein n=1 Tax=Intrasporangium flavum TaxID=1428657 RepID=UPI00096C04E0|nr:hypothetical protein [Intrasporangium flavum]